MKYWLYIFMFLFAGELSAQIPMGFMPLKQGNKWIYVDYSAWSGTPDPVKYVYTVMDTMQVIDGNSYYVVKEEPRFSGNKPYYYPCRIDSLGFYIYHDASSKLTFQNHEYRYFNIHAQEVGQYWVQKRETGDKDSLVYNIVIGRPTGHVFGQEVSMTIIYATDSVLVHERLDWSDKFGLHIQGYEGGEMDLTGCVIDGVVYGDTSRTLVSVEKEKERPSKFSLAQNYPNPFNPSTKINFQVPEASKVTLKVFDMLGKEVATLVDEYKSAGTHTIQFNAIDLPSGMYIYQLRAGEHSSMRKMMLLK